MSALALVIVGVALTIVVAVLLVWLGKMLQRPLLELEQAAHIIARGDKNAHLPVIYANADVHTATIALRPATGNSVRAGAR